MDDEEIRYASGPVLFAGVDLTLWFMIALTLMVSLFVGALAILVFVS